MSQPVTCNWAPAVPRALSNNGWRIRGACYTTDLSVVVHPECRASGGLPFGGRAHIKAHIRPIFAVFTESNREEASQGGGGLRPWLPFPFMNFFFDLAVTWLGRRIIIGGLRLRLRTRQPCTEQAEPPDGMSPRQGYLGGRRALLVHVDVHHTPPASHDMAAPLIAPRAAVQHHSTYGRLRGGAESGSELKLRDER